MGKASGWHKETGKAESWHKVTGWCKEKMNKAIGQHKEGIKARRWHEEGKGMAKGRKEFQTNLLRFRRKG